MIKDNPEQIKYDATIHAVPPVSPFVDPIVELKDYIEQVLKIPFERNLLGGHDKNVEDEFRLFLLAGKTPEDFYRESKTMLYHLAWFGEDQWKRPYRDWLTAQFPAPRKLLEYGCGIGADGLKFATQGYEVAFLDYPSKCVDFLKWRIARRGWRNPVYTYTDKVPRADVVYAFDVLEHTDQQKELLQDIERYGEFVAVNLLRRIPPPSQKPSLHYPVDAEGLLKWLGARKNVVAVHDADYALFVVYRSGV